MGRTIVTLAAIAGLSAPLAAKEPEPRSYNIVMAIKDREAIVVQPQLTVTEGERATLEVRADDGEGYSLALLITQSDSSELNVETDFDVTVSPHRPISLAPSFVIDPSHPGPYNYAIEFAGESPISFEFTIEAVKG